MQSTRGRPVETPVESSGNLTDFLEEATYSLFLPSLLLPIAHTCFISLQVLCTLVAAVIQYLFLCVFCWMLSEAIMLYFLVVRVFTRVTRYWYLLLFLGWGESHFLKQFIHLHAVGLQLR